MTVYQWTLQLPDSITPIALTLEADRQTELVPLQIKALNPFDLYDLRWKYWGWAADPYGHSLDFDRCKPEDLHHALQLPAFAPLNPRYQGPALAPWETVPPELIS